MLAANNILGIDYGRVRIGLAIARDGAPERLMTLHNDHELMSKLAEIVEREQIRTIVVGLPRNTDGDDTAWTGEVRAFITKASTYFRELEVVAQDEFATSLDAHEELTKHKAPTNRRLGYVDQQAAVILLRDYLDGN